MNNVEIAPHIYRMKERQDVLYDSKSSDFDALNYQSKYFISRLTTFKVWLKMC